MQKLNISKIDSEIDRAQITGNEMFYDFDAVNNIWPFFRVWQHYVLEFLIWRREKYL